MGGRSIPSSSLRASLVGLLAAMLAASLAPVGEAAPTPEGQILVVTANLREGYPNGNDLSNRDDMDVFVRRLLGQTPYAPDILLLQEINGPSSSYVARRMTKKTGDQYMVALKPPADVMAEGPGTSLIHTQNAVVINRESMAKVTNGGWVKTTYDQSDAAPGSRIATMRQGHVLVKERITNDKVGVMSLRFAHASVMRSKSVSYEYRRSWAKKVASAMSRKYRERASGFMVIAGDFNAGRCLNDKPRHCDEAGFWKVLTGNWGYKEVLFEEGLPQGVDYLFARAAQVFQAGLDASYDSAAAEAGREPYYSDHRFRWGIIGPN